MLGSKYDLEMQQGSTFELGLTIKDAQGNTKDLTDYSAAMQLRSSYSAATATETLSSDSGEITIDTANGTLHIVLSAERTAGIKVDMANKKPPRSVYVYDLELKDNDNKVSKLLYGDVTVYGEVTR